MMLLDVTRLDMAMDGLLDAAAMPDRWEAIFTEISQAAGAVGVNIMPVTGRLPGIPASESMRGALEEYFSEEWHLRDYRMRAIPRVVRTGTALEQDFATEETFRDEEYYKFLGKHGLAFSAIVGFRSGEDLLCFVLQRGLKQGPFDREEERILRRFQGRLSLAASIMRNVSLARVEGMAEAFDAADLACIFFDRHGLVTRLNGAAERLVGNGIEVAGRELRTWRQGDAAALHLKVKAAISSRLLTDEDGGASLVLRPERRPLVVRVQRLNGMFAEIFSHSAAVAVISDPDMKPVPSAKTLMELFRLTQTEARIALLLASGLSAKQISQQQGVGYETVRSHTMAIFRKTDTNRQSALAALFSSLRLI